MGAMRVKWDELLVLLSNLFGNVLLYGPPGTGKTFASHWLGKQRKQPVYHVTLSEDLSAQELVGHFVPKGGEFVWHNGPALLAWEHGGILNLNEIDRCSGGVEIALHSILDDPEMAKLTLPDGHTARPRPGFMCIATMNGEPDQLPPALLDRFVAKVEISEPSEKALSVIVNEDLRTACKAAYKATKPSVTFREFKAIDSMLKAGVQDRIAFCAVLGPKWEEVYQGFQARAATKKGK